VNGVGKQRQLPETKTTNSCRTAIAARPANDHLIAQSPIAGRDRGIDDAMGVAVRMFMRASGADDRIVSTRRFHLFERTPGVLR
jgi:hypothetical protein